MKQVHRAKSNGRKHRGSEPPINSPCKIRDGRQTYKSVVAAQTHNFPSSNFSTFVPQDHHLLNLSFHSHFPRHRFRAAKISVTGRHYLIGRAPGCSAPVCARKKYHCSRKQMSAFIHHEVQAD